MKFFDLHSDFPTVLDGFENISFEKDVNIIGAVYKGNLTFDGAFTISKSLKALKNRNVYLAFENIGYKDLDIDKILSLNPKYVSLTYNGENVYGYGCDYNLPLKTRGKTLVKYLYDKGVTIDVAHLSEKGAYSVLDITNKVICSHTALKTIYEHKRNLSSSLIKEILSVGGIIGLTPVGYFLKEKNASLYDYYKHIDTFVSLYGVNSLAIGTDFYGTDFIVGGIKDYGGFSKLKNLLLEKGYTPCDVDKIFYKNAYEYFNL